MFSCGILILEKELFCLRSRSGTPCANQGDVIHERVPDHQHVVEVVTVLPEEVALCVFVTLAGLLQEGILSGDVRSDVVLVVVVPELVQELLLSIFVAFTRGTQNWVLEIKAGSVSRGALVFDDDLPVFAVLKQHRVDAGFVSCEGLRLHVVVVLQRRTC